MRGRSEVHRANRRFEFGVYHAIPEHPRPMYERDTYGQVGDSLSHSAAAHVSFGDDVEVFAHVVVRNGKVEFEQVLQPRLSDLLQLRVRRPKPRCYFASRVPPAAA
jgi:hypothetical protein